MEIASLALIRIASKIKILVIWKQTPPEVYTRTVRTHSNNPYPNSPNNQVPNHQSCPHRPARLPLSGKA